MEPDVTSSTKSKKRSTHIVVKIIFGFFALIVLLVVGGYAYMGGFHRVVIEEIYVGPFKYVYREIVAAEIKKVGEITTAVADSLHSKDVTVLQPFDLYKPDGSGQIGFLVKEFEPIKLKALEPTIKSRIIPAQLCMVTTFPWKNPLSYIIGYAKVNPEFATYREKHGYKEVWAATRHDGDIITYIQPIMK